MSRSRYRMSLRPVERREYGEGPTPQQQALVTLALHASDLRREIDALVYARRKDHEHFEHQRRMLTALGAGTHLRTPRPYEGSLWRELRHAVVRWRGYRRAEVRHWWSR